MDVLHDAAELLKNAGVDGALIRRVIGELRRRWGGGSSYVCQRDRESQNEVIKTGLIEGKPIIEVAKAANCSAKTIRRRKSEWL